MPSRLTQYRLGTSVALISSTLALILAFLKCCCRVLIRRCCALRSDKLDACPVAGALAVKVPCFFSSLFELEQAVMTKLLAKVHAIKIFERVNDINNPFF